MLEVVYQNLCQCVGVCGSTFPGDNSVPNTCQNNYRSHFGMACMKHTLILPEVHVVFIYGESEVGSWLEILLNS